MNVIFKYKLDISNKKSNSSHSKVAYFLLETLLKVVFVNEVSK